MSGIEAPKKLFAFQFTHYSSDIIVARADVANVNQVYQDVSHTAVWPVSPVMSYTRDDLVAEERLSWEGLRARLDAMRASLAAVGAHARLRASLGAAVDPSLLATLVQEAEQRDDEMARATRSTT
jgi:hypothetical protein